VENTACAVMTTNMGSLIPARDSADEESPLNSESACTAVEFVGQEK